MKISRLFGEAVDNALKNHSKEEIKACIIKTDPNCTIPLIFFGL